MHCIFIFRLLLTSCISMSRFRFWWDIYWEMCPTCERWLLFSHLPSSPLSQSPPQDIHTALLSATLFLSWSFLCYLILYWHSNIYDLLRVLVSVIIKAIIIRGIVWVFHKTTFIAAKTISWDLNHFCKSLFVMNGMIMLRHDALSECKSGKTTTKLQFT